MNPVQTGIQILGKRLTHNDGNHLSILDFGNMINVRLEEMKVEMPDESEPHVATFNHQGVSGSPAHSPSRAAKAALDNKELFVSPNNLRVRSRVWSLDMREDQVDEIKSRVGSQREKSRGRTLSTDIREEKVEEIALLRDRGLVKSDSKTFVKSTLKAQNKTPKRKKKGAVFGRLYGTKI